MTISGFYYVSLRRSDGEVEGLYFDPSSTPYQLLRLKGRAAGWASSKLTPPQLVDEIYLRAYSRLPTDAERAAVVRKFGRPGAVRREVVEDLLWALINTPEFVFKD